MNTHTLASYKYIFVPSQDPCDLTLLLLHGTGGNEHSLLDIAIQIAPHANLLSVRGNVTEGTYNRFFARLAEGVFNEEEVIRRAGELSIFIAAAIETHQLANTKLVALGYSNGANIASTILLTTPTALSGAVLLRAMPTLAAPSSPVLSQKPILLISGLGDELIPPTQTKRLADQLLDADAHLTHTTIEAGHTLQPRDITLTRHWLTANF